MRACRHGTFVDLGCYDGVTYSNTWYFERKLGWSGVCVEPEPALRFKPYRLVALALTLTLALTLSLTLALPLTR